MLISFKFSNFRNYYNQSEILLEAEKDKYLEENAFVVDPALYSGKLFRTIMIMGLNGSGKTNLIRAFMYLQFLVLSSSEQSKRTSNIFSDNDERFAFSKDAADKPRDFEIEFIVDDKYYYNYQLSIQNFKVAYEALYEREITGKQRLDNKKCLFLREENKILSASESFKNLATFLDIKPNVLFISNCNLDIKDELCPSGKRVIKWFSSLEFLNENIQSLGIYDNNHEYLEKATKILQKFDKSLKNLELVKTKLDIPIEDYKDTQSILKALEKYNLPNGSAISILDDGVYNVDINAKYDVYDELADDEYKKVEEKTFSILTNNTNVSSGQSKLVQTLAYVIKILNDGGVLFWDELDNRLHHQFPELIIDAFNDSEINKNNAQLIFTTHNYMLMDNNMRKDQIYVVNKDEHGISSLQHPHRENGRIKSTNRLSNLWKNDEFINNKSITLNDLKQILL